MRIILRRFGFYFCVLFCVFIYLILAFKNPFSANSLVSNLEPYPDTLFYSVPAWNFINGSGFKMSVFGVEIKSIVPPAYGIFLMPFFKIFGDVRSFYFANIILGLISIWFFCLIVKKIFKNNLYLVLGLGFLLVTNFYFYTVPSLMMAENISIAVVLVIFYFLISKLSIKNATIFGFLTISLGLIKFSNVILLPIFLSFYGIKILADKNKFKDKIVYFLIILGFSIFYFGFIKLSGILSNQVNSNNGFSLKYFWDNFVFYKRTILGGGTRYLWFQKLFIAPIVSILSILGVLVGIVKKESQLIVLQILGIVLGLMIFMSFFYYPDGRYIQTIYPPLLILVGFVLNFLFRKFGAKKNIFLFLIIGIIYLFFSSQYVDDQEPILVSLKKQAGLNLKYKEDPWNYLAIMEFNKYFKDEGRRKYLATFLPPFYINYFYNGNYNYLPLSKNQEFSSGSKDFVNKLYSGDLKDFFKKLLENGDEVYFSNYYVSNNADLWGKDLDDLKSNFTFEQVSEGCLGSCNIYKLDSYKVKK